MRALAIGLTFGAVLAAQDGSRQYSTSSADVNGDRVAGPSWSETRTQDSYEKTSRMQNINGRMVPSESTEEQVLYHDANQTVKERLTQHYDYAGRPAGLDKVRIEERKKPDGSQTVVKASYQQDANGRFQLTEQANSRIVTSGGGRSEATVVQRPGLNGSMETVAQINSVDTKGGGREQEQVTTYRKDVNGTFYEASRTVMDRVQQQPGLVKETTMAYEVGGSGKLEPSTRTVSQIRQSSDGSEVRESTIYRSWAAGRTDPAAGLQPSEQWLVEKKPGANNTVLETTSIRKPDLNSGGMGKYEKLYETVCTGKCQSDEK